MIKATAGQRGERYGVGVRGHCSINYEGHGPRTYGYGNRRFEPSWGGCSLSHLGNGGLVLNHSLASGEGRSLCSSERHDLSAKYKDVPIIVWGTSMGGTMAINAAGEIPEVDGVISCSAFSTWPDVFSAQMIMRTQGRSGACGGLRSGR